MSNSSGNILLYPTTKHTKETRIISVEVQHGPSAIEGVSESRRSVGGEIQVLGSSKGIIENKYVQRVSTNSNKEKKNNNVKIIPDRGVADRNDTNN